MIDVRAKDDLFTKPNEPKKKERLKKDKISAGFSKKEAMKLTKTFLSSAIHDVTNNPIGGLKWTL